MHENEILVFLFASFVLIVAVGYREQIRQLPLYSMILAAYFVLWFAWLATNLEHLFLPTIFNALEHIGYLTASMLLLVWCLLGARNNGGEKS